MSEDPASVFDSSRKRTGLQSSEANAHQPPRIAGTATSATQSPRLERLAGARRRKCLRRSRFSSRRSFRQRYGNRGVGLGSTCRFGESPYFLFNFRVCLAESPGASPVHARNYDPLLQLTEVCATTVRSRANGTRCGLSRSRRRSAYEFRLDHVAISTAAARPASVAPAPSRRESRVFRSLCVRNSDSVHTVALWRSGTDERCAEAQSTELRSRFVSCVSSATAVPLRRLRTGASTTTTTSSRLRERVWTVFAASTAKATRPVLGSE